METPSRSTAPLMVRHLGSKPLSADCFGSMQSAVLIRRTRHFQVGQKVKFCPRLELRGNSTGVTPPWRSGIVAVIDDGALTLKAA